MRKISLLFILPLLVSAVVWLSLDWSSSESIGADLTSPSIKIAIIDTGLDLSISALKLCPKGHYNFFTKGPKINNIAQHGSIVSSIIAKDLANIDYCAIIYQVDSPSGIIESAIIAALKKAAKENVIAVNLSIVGPAYYEEEKAAIQAVTTSGAKVFVAAGNDSADLSIECVSYPSCYGLPDVFVIGALDLDKHTRASYSNYGRPVLLWYNGDVLWNGKIEKGTSYAAPRALSHYVSAYSQRLQHVMNQRKLLKLQ
jgi:subtilisin family serine protease